MGEKSNHQVQQLLNTHNYEYNVTAIAKP